MIKDVGHGLWTFTIPKMLRPYFLYHRELLGRLCRAGWEVVRELMAAAGDPAFRPGMVGVVQTYGDMLDWHPHVHAIATRGGWDGEGRFVPMRFVSTAAAERLFRHKVITMLRDEGLLSQERIELLMTWGHSGFSAHNAVTVPPGDTGGIERLARYLLRAPAALERLELDLEGRNVCYRAKSRGARVGAKTFEVTEFLAEPGGALTGQARRDEVGIQGCPGSIRCSRRSARSKSGFRRALGGSRPPWCTGSAKAIPYS